MIDEIIDKEKVYEAFNYFKVPSDGDFSLVQTSYGKLIKENHPDVNQQETSEEIKQKEELTKEINKYHTYLRKYYSQTKQELIAYFKSIKKDEIYLEIQKLCDVYLDKVNNLNNIKLFRELKKEFDLKLTVLKTNINKKQESILTQRKKAINNYFTYKCKQASINYSKEKQEKANFILKEILTIITIATLEDLDKILKILDDIKFQDLDDEYQVINKLLVSYDVFINIYTGDIVSLDEIDLESVLVKLLNQKSKRISKTSFKKDFISLKDFMKNCYYVGDKSVCLVDYNGRVLGQEYPLTRFLYCHTGSDLMLVYEIGIQDDYHFSFTSISKDKNIDLSWSIKDGSKQGEPKRGMFRDKELVYEAILKDLKDKRLKNKTSEIKEGIKR